MTAKVLNESPTPSGSVASALRLDRREALRLGLGLAGGMALGLPGRPAFAQDKSFPQVAIEAVLSEGKPFHAAHVAEVASTIARKDYVPPPTNLPDAFANLSFEDYSTIRLHETARVWAGEGRSFSIEPLHRGFIYTNAVTIYVVEDGIIRRVVYDPGRFSFGNRQPPADVGNLDFSGFKVFFGSGREPKREVAVFQGGTFFRAIASGQNYGVTARTLALQPADARGEEFPLFRAFWIERPAPGSDSLAMHALLDAPSAAGAVRFTLRPGDMTITDVEVALFPRTNLDHVGIGPMNATYVFGPNDGAADDVRVAAYEAKGLQILNGRGEWIWRPLSNPETLQISAFIDDNPRGFGLLQRDRDFSAFQDDVRRFELRPSLWLEPFGEWGKGNVQLIEVPTDSDRNDNVIAYWRPAAPYKAGVEANISYRLYWCWTPPERPPLAIVANTRAGRGSSGNRRRFAIDFVGERLADPAAIVEIKPSLSATPGQIHDLRLWSYPERRTLRVTFELDPGNETASELRLLLEAAGKAASETWLYRWTP